MYLSCALCLHRRFDSMDIGIERSVDGVYKDKWAVTGLWSDPRTDAWT